MKKTRIAGIVVALGGHCRSRHCCAAAVAGAHDRLPNLTAAPRSTRTTPDDRDDLQPGRRWRAPGGLATHEAQYDRRTAMLKPGDLVTFTRLPPWVDQLQSP